MRRFFLKLYRRRRLQEDLERELTFHREMAGKHQNPIPLGNTSVIKEQAFDLWRFNFIENLGRDLLLAIRGFRRSPVLVACALLSLGLGVGVNTAIFSLGMEFFFSQPSARNPESLVQVQFGNSRAPETVIAALRKSGLFADVAGENIDLLANYNDGTETIQIYNDYTTKNYFTMLGVPMLYGRGFIPADHNEVVVLSYRFWQKHFRADPATLGRAINLEGRECTVVGILPERHRTLAGFGLSPDVYQPSWLETVQLTIYARLKPDMSLKQARVALGIVARRMDAALPAERSKYVQNISVSPVSGYESFAGSGGALSLSIFFALLLMVVGLVLLIACANVAILLLARGSARRRETAVQLALGISRARLLQQFLAESVLLALLGTAFGLLLSRLTTTLIAAIEPLLPAPIHLQLTPDWRLLLYSALLMAIATIVCGLFPAWQSWKVSITPNLARERKSHLQTALVVVQIATSVIILATGFLFLHNLLRTNSISPGFDVLHTLDAEISLPPTQYANPQRRAAFVRQALREMEALPGIACAAAAKWTPFNGWEEYGVTIKFPDTGQQNSVFYRSNAVTPAYFRVMHIPIYSGRTFSESKPGVKQVIVNQPFVERYLAGRQPIGTVFQDVTGARTTSQVIAVVGSTKTRTLGEEEQPQLYESFDQTKDDKLALSIEARSAIAPALQIEPVRRALHRAEPLAGVKVQAMDATIGFAFLPSQLGAGALGSLGALGLLLATVGIYAVVAYSVVQRTREIGIRMAVGATTVDISRIVLRDAARLTLIGLSIGLSAAFFITRPLAMFLVPGLKPTDPLTFVAVAVVMVFAAITAAFGPTRRASRVDPTIALRFE